MAQRFFLPSPPLLEADGETKEQAVADDRFADIEPENVIRRPHHVHNWNINEFESSRLSNRMHCDPFPFAGHLWQPFIFPRGNKHAEGYLSAYIDCISLATADPLTRLPILFEFAVVNHKDEKNKSIASEATHLFSHHERDRGFARLAKLADILAPGSGFIDPQHNMLTIRFSLQLNDMSANSKPQLDPDYDSKVSTGFVGLKNQGATCYMNSLLQTLFHIPKFRKAVYMMPTETLAAVGSTKGEIGLALQRIFFHLQTNDAPVATKQLTQSFGWNAMESFMQHDVQEFNRVLCDSLEEKMKKTRVEGAIAQLFEGKSEMYVECINVDYQSKRTENFYDLSMTVKGCRTLLDSFRQYVEVETLAGENKYRAEGHGLQDARKGIRFTAFPPVLQLQLKRFEYDPARDQMIKVNDRFQFPETLDLSEFLHAPPDPSGEHKPPPRPVYRLHSVLVHSGNVHGGHYYAYIRPLPTSRVINPAEVSRPSSAVEEKSLPILAPTPRPDKAPAGPSPDPLVPSTGGAQSPASDADMAPLSHPLEVRLSPEEAAQRYGNAPWFKFDDEQVTAADPLHAIDKNFGGMERIATTHFGQLTRSDRMRSANAYMLVYIREADLAENLAELDRIVGDGTREGSGIPQHLQARFADEEKRRLQENFIRQHEGEYMEIAVAAEKTLIERRSIGIDVEELEHAARFKILKEARVSDLQQILAAQFGIPPERQQFWRYSKRENCTRRPNALVNTSNPHEKRVLKELCDNGNKKIHFYLRDAHELFDPRESELLSRVAQNQQAPLLVIFKMFDPLTQSLRLLGSATVKRGTPFRSLTALFLRFMGLISIPEKTVVLTRGDQQIAVRIPPTQLEYADPNEPPEVAWQRALAVSHACDLGDLGADQLPAVTALLQAAGLDVMVLEEEITVKGLFNRFSHEAVFGENMYCGDLLCLQLLPAGLIPGLVPAQPQPQPQGAAQPSSPARMDSDPSSNPLSPLSPRRAPESTGSQSLAAMAAALSTLACPVPVPVDSPFVQSRLKLLTAIAQLPRAPLPFPSKLLSEQYLKYLVDRVLVLFKQAEDDAISSLSGPVGAGVVLECAVSSRYDEVMERLVQKLRDRYAAYQQELLRHTAGQPLPQEVPRPPRSALHIRPMLRVNDRAGGSWRPGLPVPGISLLDAYAVTRGEPQPTLYYEILQFPVTDLPVRTPYSIKWVEQDLSSDHYVVTVPRHGSCTVRDVMGLLLQVRQEKLADLLTFTPLELEKRNKDREKERMDSWPVPVTPRGSDEGPPGAVPAAPIPAPGDTPGLPPLQGPHHILETAAQEGQPHGELVPAAPLPPPQPVAPPRRGLFSLSLGGLLKKKPASPIAPPDQEGMPRSPTKEGGSSESSTSSPVRVLVVAEERIVSVMLPDEPFAPTVRTLDRSTCYLRAEAVSEEDRDASHLIPIHRGYRPGPKAPVITFGPPFLFRTDMAETVASLKRRLQKRLAMPDAQFNAIRLVIEDGDTLHPAPDDQSIGALSLDARMGPQFGRRLMLEYRPRVVPGRDSYLSIADRPVKIYA